MEITAKARQYKIFVGLTTIVEATPIGGIDIKVSFLRPVATKPVAGIHISGLCV